MAQYNSILKATSIFGGTQVLQILITLVRSKFVALLIGATGMGLNAMYTSSLAIVITIFGMGINTSVVRDLSKANDEGDDNKFSIIIKVFNRMLFVLSFLGTLFVLICSPFFSKWSFGNDDYTIAYCFLSLQVLFTLLMQGNTALLIGKRRIKDTALCSLFGAIVSLLTSIPFFYFWRLDGIVPGIIVSSASQYLISLYYAKKIQMAAISITWRDVWHYGKDIFVLGFTLVLAVLVGNVTVYGINVAIRHLGDIKDIGFFNAGMSMTGQAVAMVFSAMSADYYPRLVVSLKDVKLMNETINQQMEVLLHLSAPILALFSICSPLIIRILLTEDFLIINSFIRIICFGMLMKAIGYALGNVSFAKGDKYLYMSLEGGYSNLVNFIASVGFYYLWGLKGLAWAFVFCWTQYFVVIYIVNRHRYKYRCANETMRVIVINVILMLLLLACELILSDMYYYIVASIIAFLSVAYNLYWLNKKTNLIEVFVNKFFSKNISTR